MNIQGLPSHGAALAPAATSSMASSNSAASTATSATQNANSAEQTFINLLVTELQSQDPTSPMDPTAMVGQMFQMNQLQQLIDINQTLSTALNGPPSGAANSSATAVPSNSGASLLQLATLPTSAAASYAQHLLTGAN
jgi:flagellar basal-body rod modification protein FlgD